MTVESSSQPAGGQVWLSPLRRAGAMPEGQVEQSDDCSVSRGTSGLPRRSFFGHVAGGIYGAALASLLQKDLYGDEPAHVRQSFDLQPKKPHFEPRARAVIHLY